MTVELIGRKKARPFDRRGTSLKPLGPDGTRAREGARRANRITAIPKDKRIKGASQGTPIELGTFFKTSAEFWMNLQLTYDPRNTEKALPTNVRVSKTTRARWHDKPRKVACPLKFPKI